MKKECKKLFSFLLSLTVVFTMLIGCSNNTLTDNKPEGDFYYAFCGFAGIMKNTDDKFYYLRNSIADTYVNNQGYQKNIKVNECFFDKTKRTLSIGIDFTLIEKNATKKQSELTEQELKPMVSLDGKKHTISNWDCVLKDDKLNTKESVYNYAIYVENITKLSSETKISVSISDTKIEFNLDEEIGTPNINELGVKTHNLDNGLTLVINAGYFNNKSGFYLDLFTDGTHYDSVGISKIELFLQNSTGTQFIPCKDKQYSSVLGSSTTVFCSNEDNLIEGITDFSNYSFLFDMVIQYNRTIKDNIIVDVVDANFPFEVSVDVPNNENIKFFIDRKTNGNTSFLEITTQNFDVLNEFFLVKPHFSITVLENDIEAFATEIKTGKQYVYDLQRNTKEVVLKICAVDFRASFEGEI